MARSVALIRHPAVAVCAALAALTAGAATAAAQEPSIDFSKAWFQPALTEDRSPLCADVLAYSRELFASTLPLDTLDPAMLHGLEAVEPETEANPRGPGTGQLRFVLVHDRKIYFADMPAYGGTRSERQAFVWPASAAGGPDLQTRSEPTPPSNAYRLLRAGDTYYAGVMLDDAMQLFELTQDAAWASVCRVRLKPEDFRNVDDAAVRAGKASIDRFLAAVHGLTRGGGSCGTTDPLTSAELDALVYRPRPPRPADDSAASRYEVDMRDLAAWALTGLSERDALRAYEQQLELTTAQLTELYVSSFGLPRDDARRWATAGLRGAVASGIWFSQYGDYWPFAGEAGARLRKAILERRPLDELRAIDVPLRVINGDGSDNDAGEESRYPFAESLLDTAIDYPEAVAYLLELGADPNKGNSFGKMPLMYAAQRNALDSARLLLDAGADPNAVTIWPKNQCHALTHASMTALHYAVRYASAAFVELLLERGAVTYVKTIRQFYVGKSESVLDWLQMYNAIGAMERNPNIRETEVARLAARLAIPDAPTRAALATRLAVEAERRYAAGDPQAAYDTLLRAQHADEDSVRVLSDLSLVALRMDQPGEAAHAGARLIEITKDPAMEANAWFNIGLACDRPDARYTIMYDDGLDACPYNAVVPFIQSWRSQPTTVRAEKLAAVFASHETCGRTRTDGSVERYILANGINDVSGPQSSRIYAYHPASMQVDPQRVRWQGPSETRVDTTMTVIARHELGEYAVSVLATAQFKDQFYGTVTIGDVECGSDRAWR